VDKAMASIAAKFAADRAVAADVSPASSAGPEIAWFAGRIELSGRSMVLAGLWTGILGCLAFGAILVQTLAPASGAIAILAGACLVLCGTLLMARLSHSRQALVSVLSAFIELKRRVARTAEMEEQRLHWFLQAANHFRYGKIRPAEQAAHRIPPSILRRGTQLVLDGFQPQQVSIALQRQINEQRTRLQGPVELLRGMAGYAPTLGMLGTLLGLVQMLFGVSSGDIDSIGASMGFALLTTVYGLVLANLVLKPLATKLEHSGRQRMQRSIIEMQAVLLLYERQHPEYLREVMNDLQPERRTAGPTETVGLAESLQLGI
jgi:chemotaxis protein MotA